MYRLAILSVVLFLLAGCTTYHHSDFTKDDYLSADYHWFDEGKTDSYEIKGGYLKITAKSCQDLWGGSPIKRGAPIMWLDAPSGDYDVDSYVIATKYPSGPQNINTQVGLFVFQGIENPPYVDVDNWLFFGFTHHDFEKNGDRVQGDGLIVTKTINDSSSIVTEQAWSSDKATLKIAKRGNTWNFYTVQGLLGSVTASFADQKVGMGVKSFDVVPFGMKHDYCGSPHLGVGKFDYFKVEAK